MTRPGRSSGPDPWDAELSALHIVVDSLGPWLAIWQARREPDAHARRCASDAVDAINTALAALHSIRARLIGETRQADDQAAAQVDELLAKMRDGPPVPLSGPRDRRQRTASPRPDLRSDHSEADDSSRAPRETAS